MLTVDLGNSRLKACLWRAAPEPECLARLDVAGDALAELERWLAPLQANAAVLSSVGSTELSAQVQALLGRRVARLHVSPESGLENRCRAPERVGPDRLYAAAGAAVVVGCSAVVVDAGTALTVDALRLEGATRAFLGGAIAPGPGLLAAALASGTARLPRVDPTPGAHALGRITEEAIQAGVVVGFRGAAERLVEEVAEEAGLREAPVVLTGGARVFLLEPHPFTMRRLHVVPELVQRGLLAALLRAERAPVENVRSEG